MQQILAAFVRDWALTVLIETAVLWRMLEPRHPRALRIRAGWWLSTCTLPLVQFVFPLAAGVGVPRWLWLTAAEVFAPVAECLLFAALVRRDTEGTQQATRRDVVAIVVANLASFAVGEGLGWAGLR